MHSRAIVEPTAIMGCDVTPHSFPLPVPPVTGNTTQDRLVMHAYSRLKNRLSREARTTTQCLEAVKHYQRVVAGILGPDAPVTL